MGIDAEVPKKVRLSHLTEAFQKTWGDGRFYDSMKLKHIEILAA
jgi:hypothetical protein